MEKTGKTKRTLTVVIFVSMALFAMEARASAPYFFTSKSWCADTLTLCWYEGRVFPGIRVIGEPAYGIVFQKGRSSFDSSNFQLTPKTGFEFAAVDSWLAAQLVLIPPFTVQMSPDSNVLLRSPDRSVRVQIGWSAGIALLDGLISGGAGILYYQHSEFVDPGQSPGDVYFFANVQPVSAFRTLFKNLKADHAVLSQHQQAPSKPPPADASVGHSR